MGDTELPYEVRWATADEWKPAMVMIWKTFLKYEGQDYSPEGVQNFFEFITDDGLYKSFLDGRYQMMVAIDDGRVIGAGSIRSKNHLSLLFVDEDYHRRGVGSTLMNRLCEYLKREAGERFMSVQAAPYAVAFYQKLGFRIVKPEEDISGIRVTAMEKRLR